MVYRRWYISPVEESDSGIYYTKSHIDKITKGVLENFRVYVTGTDIWENSKINDGWDPEEPAR